MKLYERDYSTPIYDIEKDCIEIEKQLRATGCYNVNDSPVASHPNPTIKKFLNHYFSFYPNNYLYKLDLRTIDLNIESELFLNQLDTAKKETDIQKYIKEKRKWFIPASLFKLYGFGHKDAYIFPEFRLGEKYIADYMLLGKNSDGYSMVFVEFEDVNIEYILKSRAEESESVRKGLAQIHAWKRWIDKNRHYLLTSIDALNKGINIPTTRIYYCLVVSRREKMTETARELRSQRKYESTNLSIVSYDRLVDYINDLSMGY